MPSNDEVLFAMPGIQCPSCESTLDTSSGKRIDKYSKEQRERRYGTSHSDQCSVRATPRKSTRFDYEDAPSEYEENNFLVLSCSNPCCEQYNKFKVLRIKRIHTPSIKVDL